MSKLSKNGTNQRGVKQSAANLAPDAGMKLPKNSTKQSVAKRTSAISVRGSGTSKLPKNGTKQNDAKRTAAIPPARADFDVVLGLIDAARTPAYAAVNTGLIDLYWSIGEYISLRVVELGWGKGTVKALADYIERRHPGMSGFSTSNLWRMRQFFETYRGEPKLAPLVRELSWTHNMLILSRCKREQEREFYLRACHHEKWGKRELERQLATALFERTILSPPKLAPVVRELHPDADAIFKDIYFVEFLDLPTNHSEADLHLGLIEKPKQFLIELGRDFCYVGSQYPVQVGRRPCKRSYMSFTNSRSSRQTHRRLKTASHRVDERRK